MLKIQNRVEQPCNNAQSNGNISVAKNQLADNNSAPATNDRAEPIKYLWIRAPKAIVYSQSFTDGAKLLYLILLDYQGRNSYAFPSLETLARDTGKSTRRVQQILKELEAGGAIEIISQPGWVNLYRVGLPVSTIEPTSIIAAPDDAIVTTSPETELADTSITIDGTASSLLHLTPPKYIAPLPMKPISNELDAIELENTVCKTSRVSLTHESKLLSLNTSNQQPIATSNHTQSARQNTPTTPSRSYVKLQTRQSGLTNEQVEIANLLHVAGVASVDAERIALTNPDKSNVQHWIEFAKNKANPGGYLAVVLGKVDATPPPSPSKPVNLTVSQDTPVTSQGQHQAGKTWRGNKRGNANNQESGAIAYIRRHQNELEKWQDEQYQASANASEQATNQSNSYVKLSGYTDEQFASIGLNEQAVEINQPPVSPSDETSEPHGTTIIDPQVRGLIRQLDKQSCQYLRQACIEGDKLVISFVGNYQPQQDVRTWLPLLKLSYESLNEVLQQ